MKFLSLASKGQFSRPFLLKTKGTGYDEINTFAFILFKKKIEKLFILISVR